MGWIAKLLGGDSVVEPIVAVGNIIDQIFTSDDEREQAAMLQAASELETAPLRWGGLWGHYGRNGAFCDRPHFELLIED